MASDTSYPRKRSLWVQISSTIQKLASCHCTFWRDLLQYLLALLLSHKSGNSVCTNHKKSKQNYHFYEIVMTSPSFAISTSKGFWLQDRGTVFVGSLWSTVLLTSLSLLILYVDGPSVAERGLWSSNMVTVGDFSSPLSSVSFCCIDLGCSDLGSTDIYNCYIFVGRTLYHCIMIFFVSLYHS